MFKKIKNMKSKLNLSGFLTVIIFVMITSIFSIQLNTILDFMSMVFIYGFLPAIFVLFFKHE